MYISRLHIEGYRGIKAIDIDFKKQLNIIIGENNTGKTAIIDALRICCEYGNQRRSVYISPDDFFFDKELKQTVKTIVFDCYLEQDNPNDKKEAAIFYELIALSPEGKTSFEIHHRYTIEKKNGRDRVSSTVWGGSNTAQPISQYVSSLLDCIYVDPLRDADRYLTPSGNSQVGSLLRQIVPNSDDQERMAKTLETTLKGDTEWGTLLRRGESQINAHLSKATFISEPQRINLDILPFSFKGVANTSFLRIPWPGLTEEESREFSLSLRQNGLGLNNIIYICTILGNIQGLRETDTETYLALLIEEPESHLHPQLQNTLFEYLGKMQGLKVQVFLTSHSPTITAKTDLDFITVLKHGCAQAISAFSPSKSTLDSKNKRYLSKFLDVTKSQLFFANGVIVVEGISEAILLETFASIIGANTDKYNLARNGIEIVAINGVSFEPFAKLFNNEQESKRMDVRCAIISDDDRDKNTDRTATMMDYQGGLLRVYLARNTFEYELVVACSSNLDIILEAYSLIHPQNAKGFSKTGDLNADGLAFVDRLKKDGTGGKSEFAQTLNDYLEQHPDVKSSFVVPTYIVKAIRWAVEGYIDG